VGTRRGDEPSALTTQIPYPSRTLSKRSFEPSGENTGSALNPGENVTRVRMRPRASST
jgi:hypothetical protein